ncbi:golgin subfamily A member 2 [Microdochium nivale]|nr:golgin subfamily A member 2 [Microdochium nivale]
MADDEKAQKLAAAKKRVEQMKKKNAKKGTAKAVPAKDKDDQPKEEPPRDDSNATPNDENAEKKGDVKTEPKPGKQAPVTKPTADDDSDSDSDSTDDDGDDDSVAELPKPPADDQSPMSPTTVQQSKMRSSSFRHGPLSPGLGGPPGEGETAPDIYRKQVARIEDLEKENKRLAKEAADSEKRRQKAEDELEDLREDEGKSTDDAEVEKLKAELAALQRQNAQLQSAAQRRHSSQASVSLNAPTPPSELQAQLDSKSATIESMELEISRLRAQSERQASNGGSDREQVVALEEKLARSEQAAIKAQRELGDAKKNLERTAERAVKEGSERTSAETKIRTMEQDYQKLQEDKAELDKKVEALEKKVAALGSLHKENDSRSQALRKEKEKAEKEAKEALTKVEKLEAENARLRKKDAAEGGGNDDDVDELEDEERQRMQKKIRDLESEVYDLQRGIWHQKRREMEPGMTEDITSPNGGGFTNIDLGSGLASPISARKGFGEFLASGLNALTGAGTEEHEGLLEDDDLEFDEEAFRKAQEDDAKTRLERIKEIKRGLKNWEGWRLDLVDSRRGGGGYGGGQIFEV